MYRRFHCPSATTTTCASMAACEGSAESGSSRFRAASYNFSQPCPGEADSVLNGLYPGLILMVGWLGVVSYIETGMLKVVSCSKSSEGVTLNFPSALFTAARTMAKTDFSSSNLISVLVG